MILLIGGEKGGTGKSTIATNLAVSLAHNGEEVLIMDCDPQSTSSKWLSRRQKNTTNENLPKIFGIQKTGDIFDTIEDVKNRYKHIIIDAGGRDSEELRTAMVGCDKMYMPLKASQPDLETSKHMLHLVKLAKKLNPKLSAVMVISMASTNPSLNEDKEARELLAGLSEVGISPVIIRERKVYRDAIVQGLGVVECANKKAITEINELRKEVWGE